VILERFDVYIVTLNEKGERGREVVPMSSLQSIVQPAVTDGPEAILRLWVEDPLIDRVTVKQLFRGVLAVAFT
jgi:hypothetical protein